MLKRLIPIVLCLALITPAALALSGQTLENFQSSYAENVYFINDNTGRHLLPLVLTIKRVSAEIPQRRFELKGDVLSVSGVTDVSGKVIESCDIHLSAPDDMRQGSASYNDFTVSGYHCYALLMAMDTSETPLERYALVTAIESAMRDGGGGGIVQRGVYRLSGEKLGQRVLLSFINTSLVSNEPEHGDDNIGDG